jgi:hypothetical protein
MRNKTKRGRGNITMDRKLDKGREKKALTEAPEGPDDFNF